MNDGKMARLLIVDKHPVICQGLSLYLSSIGYTAPRCMTSAREACDCIDAQSADIVILDVDLADGDGIELIANWSGSRSCPDFLVFSSRPVRYYASRSLAAGASGFVSKNDDISKVAAALVAIGDGYSYFPDGTQRHGRNILSDQEMIEALTDRELAAFKVLARGEGRQRERNTMGIGGRSLSAVKPVLYRKLGVSNVVELIDLARRNGLA